VGGVVRPRPCPAGPTAGEYGGRAMRLRLGRACLLAEVVGAWQQAKGGDAWWTAGRRAGPGRSASSPERGSARATAAPAGPGPMTPVHAPRRPATGAAGRAASTAGRSTATATCSTWSTAAGRWWRSSTGSGGSGGRASAALRGMGCGHGVDGLAGAAVGSSSGLAPRWRPQVMVGCSGAPIGRRSTGAWSHRRLSTSSTHALNTANHQAQDDPGNQPVEG
jgi:hypothetical protein